MAFTREEKARWRRDPRVRRRNASTLAAWKRESVAARVRCVGCRRSCRRRQRRENSEKPFLCVLCKGNVDPRWLALAQRSREAMIERERCRGRRLANERPLRQSEIPSALELVELA